MKTFKLFLTLCFLSVGLSVAQDNQSTTSQKDEDEKGVYAAVEDYLEGIYNVQPERIERSVSKDLVKFGYWRESADEAYAGSAMSYDKLHRLATRWNVDNRMKIDSDTPRKIEVLDVLDKTAVAKLTAHWGIDYFQLEKMDGKWMIRHVLWQAHPIPTDK